MANLLLSATVDRWDGQMLHQYDLKGNYIQSFPCGPYMRTAVNFLLRQQCGWVENIEKWIRERARIEGNMRNVVNGHIKSAYGYMWVRTYDRAKEKIPAYKSRTGEHLKKPKNLKTKPKKRVKKNK